MSLAASAFLYMAIGASGGALAFLTGQRASGRTPPEVKASYEHAAQMETLVKELRELCEQAEKSGAEEAREELARARAELEDAIAGLRRGADLVV